MRGHDRLQRKNMERGRARSVAGDERFARSPGEQKVGDAAAVIEAVDGLAFDAGEIDDRQRGCSALLRENDGDIGEQSARYARSGSCNLTRFRCHGRDSGQGIRPRNKGDGTDRLAAREARKPARPLLVATVKLDRLGRPEARRQERRAAERPPRLMRDQPQLDEAEVKATIGLGERERGPALFLRRRPETIMILAAGLEKRE